MKKLIKYGKGNYLQKYTCSETVISQDDIKMMM